MIKYSIDRNRMNKIIMGLYRRYFPEKYLYMKKLQLNREIEFWIVAKDGERIVGCMGIKKDNYNYRYLHIVVHPDYRSQSIGNNIRYMAIKFCMDDGAKIVSFMKEDNQFSHERFKEIGFQEQSRFGEYTYYLRNVKDLELGKLRKIWKNITG